MTDRIQIDLTVLAEHARLHWSDNWNFRSYLKQNFGVQEIDSVAHRITAEVTALIDCTSCGNCCREIQPFMTDQDVLRLSQGLGKSLDELRSVTRVEDGHRVFCESPCPMLKENKCTVYEVRPLDCREYPHCDKPDFIGRSIGFIENYGTCPIIYNVWNRLKGRFDYDRSVDYIGDIDPEA